MTRKLKVPLIGGFKPSLPRSPKWPAVRKAHLKREPFCRACGGKDHLEVHHKEPFHLHVEDPEKWPVDRELDPANLITLCESESHNCHLWVGHLGLWQSYNVHVETDADLWLAKIRARP